MKAFRNIFACGKWPLEKVSGVRKVFLRMQTPMPGLDVSCVVLNNWIHPLVIDSISLILKCCAVYPTTQC